MALTPTGTPQRILLLGPGGAGKSTLGRELGERSGLPVHHLDMTYWRPGWVEPTREEWRDQLGPLLAEPRWIIDGNYGGTAKQRAARADLVVLLDLPRRVTMPRIVRRWLRHRGRSRPDVAPDCPERLTAEFLRYCWNYRRVSLPKMHRRLHEAGVENLVVLRSRREVAAFLDAWPSSGHGGPAPAPPDR